MTEVVKEDIIEDYAKLFCRRHRDREFNPTCDDCLYNYETLLELKRDMLLEAAAKLRRGQHECFNCPSDLEDMAESYD